MRNIRSLKDARKIVDTIGFMASPLFNEAAEMLGLKKTEDISQYTVYSSMHDRGEISDFDYDFITSHTDRNLYHDGDRLIHSCVSSLDQLIIFAIDKIRETRALDTNLMVAAMLMEGYKYYATTLFLSTYCTAHYTATGEILDEHFSVIFDLEGIASRGVIGITRTMEGGVRYPTYEIEVENSMLRLRRMKQDRAKIDFKDIDSLDKHVDDALALAVLFYVGGNKNTTVIKDGIDERINLPDGRVKERFSTPVKQVLDEVYLKGGLSSVEDSINLGRALRDELICKVALKYGVVLDYQDIAYEYELRVATASYDTDEIEEVLSVDVNEEMEKRQVALQDVHFKFLK